MPTQLNSSPITKTLIITASLVIIVAGMKAASEILVPFLLAVFISIIVTPIYFSLQRAGLNSAVTLLVMIAAVIVIGVATVWIGQRSITDFFDKEPGYEARYADQIRQLEHWLHTWRLMQPEQSLGDLLGTGAITGYFHRAAWAVQRLLGQATLILIVVIFILLEAAAMPAKIRALPGLTDETWNRVVQIVGDTRRYITLKTLTSGLTGLLVWMLLSILRVDSAEFLGLLAFVLNFVPTIGSIVAGIPGVLLAFVQHGPATAAIAIVGYLAINFGVSNGVEPRFMGPRLGISPLVIIVSMFFFGWVLGPVGMLLSVPLAMTVKIALEADPETRWIALLMSSGAGARSVGRRKKGKAPGANR